jgi:BASS family bile acid:Na+ symporter
MSRLAAGLAWLGRHASPIFFVGVFAGVALPPLAALLKPLILPAILLPFVAALLKLEPNGLYRQARQPGLVFGLIAWSLVGAPIVVALTAARLPPSDPGLAALLVTTAACAPLMATPALAMLLRLDVTLALLVVVPATALMPFTVPPMALWLAGLSLDVPAFDLSLRLAVLVIGSGTLALVVRHRLGPQRLEQTAPVIDGLAVLGFIVFAIGVMDGFTATAIDRPAFVLLNLAAVFALNIGLQVSTALCLLPLTSRRVALTGGLIAGNNNLGLVLASIVDAAPSTLLVFVAAAQFPIYLLPIVQRRLYPLLLEAERRE